MKVECGNCGRVWHEKDLAHVFPDIPDLTKRIAPGEPVPYGECPECGALAHAVDDRRSLMCKVCGRVVKMADIREHLVEHNPNAENMEWEDVRNQFRLLSSDETAGASEATTALPASIRTTIEEVLYATELHFKAVCDEDSERLQDVVDGMDISIQKLRGLLSDLSSEQAKNGPARKVVVAVRGGVAEVVFCQKGVHCEIRDYDTEGCDEDDLEEDGAIAAVFEGEDE